MQQVYEYQPYEKNSTNVEFVLIPLENSEKEIMKTDYRAVLVVYLIFYVCSYVTTDNIKYQSSPSLSRKNSDNITLAIFFLPLLYTPSLCISSYKISPKT